MRESPDPEALVDPGRIDVGIVEAVVEQYEAGEYESMDIENLVAFGNAEVATGSATHEIMIGLGENCPERGHEVVDLFSSGDQDLRTGAIELWSNVQYAFPDEVRRRAVRVATTQLAERDDPNTNEQVYHWIVREVEDGIPSEEDETELLGALVTATDPYASPYSAAWMGRRGVETLYNIVDVETVSGSEVVGDHFETLLTEYDETDFEIDGDGVQPDVQIAGMRGYAALGLCALDTDSGLTDAVTSSLVDALEQEAIHSHRDIARACEQLAAFGGEDALDVLQELEEHRSDRVQKAAKSAVTRLQ